MRPLKTDVRTALWATGFALLGLAACGGGGGGGNRGGNNSGVTPNTRTATPTLSPRPGDPTFTATPTEIGDEPTPTPTAIQVPIGGDIAAVIRNAPAGAVIMIPGGTYAPFVLNSSNVRGPISLIADTTGRGTGGAIAPVIINAPAGSAAITLQGLSDVVLDGFTVSGGSVAAIDVRESTGITIRNSFIRQGRRDGIRLLRSAHVLVFNNLIYNNAGAGVFVVGSSDVAIINNTLYGNGDPGISIGDEVLPSDTIFVRNNIISANSPRGIIVHPSTIDYDSDFNINTDGYGSQTAVGPNEINADPRFSNPRNDEGFKLPATDDDCNGGGPAQDAGDLDIEASLLEILATRTTQSDGRPDCIGEGCCPEGCTINSPMLPCARIGTVDLGFHYIAPRTFFTPTATPRPTRTPRTPVSATATSGSGAETPTPTPTLPDSDRPTRTPIPTRTLVPTRTPR